MLGPDLLEFLFKVTRSLSSAQFKFLRVEIYNSAGYDRSVIYLYVARLKLVLYNL